MLASSFCCVDLRACRWDEVVPSPATGTSQVVWHEANGDKISQSTHELCGLSTARALLHISTHLTLAEPCFGLLSMPCKVCLSGGAASLDQTPEQSRVLSQTLARNKYVRRTARKSRISKRESIAGISF